MLGVPVVGISLNTPFFSSPNSKSRELSNESTRGGIGILLEWIREGEGSCRPCGDWFESCWLQQSSRDLEALIQLVVQILRATRETPNNYPPHPLQITSEERALLHSINCHTVI